MEELDFLWEPSEQSEMDTTGESDDSYDMTAPHCAARPFCLPPPISMCWGKMKQLVARFLFVGNLFCMKMGEKGEQDLQISLYHLTGRKKA
jgi:hypothetical protein